MRIEDIGIDFISMSCCSFSKRAGRNPNDAVDSKATTELGTVTKTTESSASMFSKEMVGEREDYLLGNHGYTRDPALVPECLDVLIEASSGSMLARLHLRRFH
ncbi:hypothetical protein AKJ16_DCAP10112 [Drosera capensis]